MKIKKMVAALCTSALLVGGAVLGATTAASASGGSDSPTPYTVDTTGITLPTGDTFPDNGHVNIKTTAGDKGLHFEAQNWPADHPKKFYIGKSFLPWSAFGLTCGFDVTWVQISMYDEHFGEGGQTPITVPCGDTPGQCIVDTIEHEAEYREDFKYSKDIPAVDEVKHTEWQYRTRVERPSNTVERKFVKGYDFVDGGSVTFSKNGGGSVTVSGHWVQSPGWHQISDSVINAYWGSGGIAQSLLGGSEANPKGDVLLSVYGGPGVSVKYYASEETITGGYSDWGPWSAWTTTNPGGDTQTREVKSREVITVPGSSAKTVYYLPGGGQSDDNTDANWTTDKPGAPWTQIDDREVKTKDAWVEYEYGDCPPVFTPVTPPIYVDNSCLVQGSVSAPETDDYSWKVTGPDNARVYTAQAKPGFTLTGQTVFGPYDTTLVSHKAPECLPTITVVVTECTPEGTTVKVTYTNNSKWDRWPDYHYTGDGVTPTNYGSGDTYKAVKVPAGETKVIWGHTFPEDYNNGSVTIQIQDILGGERDIDAETIVRTLDTDCIAPQPEDKVVETEWKDGKYECGDTTVEQTREVTTTPYILVDGEWKLDTENSETVTEKRTRDLTSKEIKALDCPTPPPSLPHTGADVAGPLGLAGGLTLLGLIGLALAKRRSFNA